VLVLVTSGCALFPSGGSSGGGGPTGCATSKTPHIAPGGYYVNGNTVCTTARQAHLFHGVDRPSLEFSPTGQMLNANDFRLMASWNANAVRVALNQDFWLEASPIHSAGYPELVDQVVRWAEEAGMDVILDLHWSDAGVLGSCTSMCQQRMADSNSITFWSEVAARYKDDGRVLFELYNEPHDLTWTTWLSGGDTGAGWRAAGMQELYNAVRAAGADNLVIAGGLDFAYDLSGVQSTRIAGYNILYGTHPYNNSSSKIPSAWDAHWGYLTKTDPVIITEFGDTACATMYDSQLLAYADAHTTSWTSWAWYVGGCNFPSLITDWQGTPNAPGMVVKTALLGYNDPAPAGKRPVVPSDAGATPDADGSADANSADSAGAQDDGGATNLPDGGADADDALD